MFEGNNKKIVLEEGASRFRNFIATGGSLCLSSFSLCFKGKPSTHGTCDIEIALSNIDEVTYFKTLNINPNGLTIMLKSGDLEHFVVDDRKKWHNAITQCLKSVA